LKDTVSSLLEYSKELLAENLSPEMPTEVSLEQAGTDPSVTSTTMIGEVVTETASRAMENLTVGREENMATNLTANAFAATHAGVENLAINLTSTSSTSSFEENTLSLEDLAASLDTLFLVVMTIFVLMLPFGFAFREAGLVRSKNVTNTLIIKVLLLLISGMAYFVFGYMISYSEGNSFLGLDLDYLAFLHLVNTKAAHWIFSFALSATSASIVSGAMAERTEMKAFLIYSAVMSGFIFPVAVHWAWTEQGWLGAVGYQDFAGAGVVHLVGGVGALVGAVTVGPRLGRFGRNGATLERSGHSMPLTTLGGFILFIGLLAVNAGSQEKISTAESVGVVQLVLINTILSGAAGGLVALLWFRFYLGGPGKSSLAMTINGMVAGMVAISASCNRVDPHLALLVGLLAAVSFILVHHTMLWFNVDDPVDAVAVHAGGGAIGLLVAPFVFRSGGVFDPEAEMAALGQVWAQFAGVLVLSAWAGATSAFLFVVLRLPGCLRVPHDVELAGIDLGRHEASYPTQETVEVGGEKGMELLAKSWRSPDTVEFLKFRKKSDSSLDSEMMMGGLVNEGFEDSVDGNDSITQTKEDGTQETHFNAGWKEVNEEIKNSIAHATIAEKEAEAKESEARQTQEESSEYGDESKIDFGEEESEEEAEEEVRKVEHLDISHIEDTETEQKSNKADCMVDKKTDNAEHRLDIAGMREMDKEEVIRVDQLEISYLMDLERWSNLPISLEYSEDSRESSVI